jgi:hypothetical protein
VKTDLYTKVVLSVIALCLAVLCLQHISLPLSAASVQPVQIVGSDAPLPITINGFGEGMTALPVGVQGTHFIAEPTIGFPWAGKWNFNTPVLVNIAPKTKVKEP